MSYRGRDRAIQLLEVEPSADFTKHIQLSLALEYEQRDSANKTIIIATHKICSAVNCPIVVGIVPISWFELRALLISKKTHTAVINTRTRTHRERARANETIVIVTDKAVSAVNCPIKVEIVPLSWFEPRDLLISQSTLMSSAHERERDNCNRHSQVLQRSQLSDKGRDRATQSVVVETSVDFTKDTLLFSAHQQKQRDSANKTTVIVTHKVRSAVNCPIEVEIVPLSWLLLRYLSISQSTHCCHQHANTNRETVQTIVIVTHKLCSAVNCPIKDEIVPFSWLLLRYLLIS